MRFICTCIISVFTILCHQANGQLHFIEVIGEDDRQAIPGAVFSFENRTIATTNKQGRAELSSMFYNKTIVVRAAGFQDTTVVFSYSLQSIYLKEKSYNLREVSISGSDLPRLEWSSIEYHVFDFGFVGDVLVVLVFEKEKRWKSQNFKDKTLLQNCALIAMDEERRELDTLEVGDGYWDLDASWLGNLFLVGEKAHRISFNHGLVLEELDNTDYVNHWANLRYNTDSFVYREEGNDNYPERQFEMTYLPLNYAKVFCSIRDSFSMELLRSEWKYLSGREKVEAFHYASALGVEKEIVAAYMRGFQQTHYYAPVYANLLPLADGVAIADLTNGLLKRFSSLGSLQRTNSLEEITERGWKSEHYLLSDLVAKSSYRLAKKNGVCRLYKLSLDSGKFIFVKDLHYPNVVNVQVRGGRVFYAYRTFESPEKIRLYSEYL
jgi:hypothetical protein